MFRRRWFWLFIILLIVAGAGAYYYYTQVRQADPQAPEGAEREHDGQDHSAANHNSFP